MNNQKEQDALEVQQHHEEANLTTETPVELLVAAGVDPSWAKEYVDFEQKYDHFSSSVFIWMNVSPRFIRLAVKRPESLIRLIKEKWEKTADKRPGDTSEKNAQYDLTEWHTPRNKTWRVNQLAYPIELFEKGLSPMEALIEIHSDCEDGQEEDEIIVGGTYLLPIILVIGLTLILLVASIPYLQHAAEAATAAKSVAGL
jgi:hypothetical protein